MHSRGKVYFGELESVEAPDPRTGRNRLWWFPDEPRLAIALASLFVIAYAMELSGLLDAVIDRNADILERIGIAVVRAPVAEDSFLPGIDSTITERLADLALTVSGFGSRTQTLALNLHQNATDVDQMTTAWSVQDTTTSTLLGVVDV